jgi:DNA polymerase III sliding clamp (beta) subunit (PCNA family)
MLLITDGALSIDDFPAGVDRAPLEDFAATLGPDHMALMARVAGAASTEETRYYLTGVSVVPDGATGFKLRATNGHMLFVAALRCPDIRGKLASEIIIPRKTVNLLLQLASKAEDGVRLTVGRAPATNVASPDMGATDGVRISFAFTVPGMKIVLICKPIDGTYPDVTRVIPTAGHPQMLFKTAGLRRALGAVSGFCKATRAVKVELHDDDTATLSAAYIDKGLSTAVRIACQNRRPGFTVGFSGEYLGKILNAARGEEIVVDTADASSAALIRNPADPDWTGVLMPIRI